MKSLKNFFINLLLFPVAELVVVVLLIGTLAFCLIINYLLTHPRT